MRFFTLIILSLIVTPFATRKCSGHRITKYHSEILLRRHCESFAKDGPNRLLASSCTGLYSVTFGPKHKVYWKRLGTIEVGHIIKQILPLGRGRILVPACDGHVGSLYISCDGGRHFTTACDSTGEGQILSLDRSSNTIYAAGIKSPLVFASHDLGNTWQEIPSSYASLKSYTCSFLTRKLERHLQFVLSCSRPGIILASDDTGKTWRTLLTRKSFAGRELPQVAGNGKILAVCAIDEYDSSGFDCFLYAGHSWKSSKNGFSAWALDIDRSNPSKICLGHFAPNLTGMILPCVYESLDQGKSWHGLDSIGADYVWMVQYLPNGGILVATDKGLLQLTPNSTN